MFKCVDCGQPECPKCLNCHTLHCDSSVICKTRKYIKGYKVLMVDKKVVDVDIGDVEMVKIDDEEFEEYQKRWTTWKKDLRD